MVERKAPSSSNVFKLFGELRRYKLHDAYLSTYIMSDGQTDRHVLSCHDGLLLTDAQDLPRIPMFS